MLARRWGQKLLDPSRICALRETFEEAGVLLMAGHGTELAPQLPALRKQCNEDPASFRQMVATYVLEAGCGAAGGAGGCVVQCIVRMLVTAPPVEESSGSRVAGPTGHSLCAVLTLSAIREWPHATGT